MAWTRAQYDNLCAAIAEGALEVEYEGGKRVKYHSLRQMLNLKSRMESELGILPPGKHKSRRTVADFRKGT